MTIKEEKEKTVGDPRLCQSTYSIAVEQGNVAPPSPHRLFAKEVLEALFTRNKSVTSLAKLLDEE